MKVCCKIDVKTPLEFLALTVRKTGFEAALSSSQGVRLSVKYLIVSLICFILCCVTLLVFSISCLVFSLYFYVSVVPLRARAETNQTWIMGGGNSGKIPFFGSVDLVKPFHSILFVGLCPHPSTGSDTGKAHGVRVAFCTL